MSNVAKRLEKAEKYLEKGKLDAALDEYVEALAEDPGNDFVRERAADLYLSRGRDREAAELFGQLFERYAESGRDTDALNNYRKLARLAPVSVERALRFAKLVHRSSPREAVEAYQSALAQLVTSDRKEQALSVIGQIVALEPNPENVERQGNIAAQLGERGLAANCFLQLGRSTKNAGKAAGYYARAFALDPYNPQVAMEHSRVLLAQGDMGKVISSLGPFITPEADPSVRETYATALLQANRAAEAEPVIWGLLQTDAQYTALVGKLITAYLQAGDDARAAQQASRLHDYLQKSGESRDLIFLMRNITHNAKPGVEFLEFLAKLYNSTNREHEYCETLLTLFDLYFASRNYPKAADCLDRAADVDPYEPGHEKRLEMLRGKIDSARFNAVANRISTGTQITAPLADMHAPPVEDEHALPQAEKEPTLLEDLMLQAEIFLQYAMKPKALERLERITKLFPHEEENNEKLRQLFVTASFTPRYGAHAAGSAAAAAPANAAAGESPFTIGDETAVNNFSKVNLISRNISRQSTVKSVLFTAVNDAGRHWNASRCLAGLCAPGKPPSAAVEYCAPGVEKSDITALVKLIAALQTLAAKKNGAVVMESAQTAPELEAIRSYVNALGIVSLIAVPLIDGEEHAGILILEQCGMPRVWRAVDELVLKTISEQVVLAVNNAKLRSLVKTLAIADEKSGMLKRASYTDVLLSEVRRSAQQKTPVTVMLLKLGGKTGSLVKELGEPQIDAFIREAGQTITQNLRQNDVAIRYDLTTIALILADTSDKNAQLAYDKFRKVLSSMSLPGRKDPCPLTAGIAEAFIHAKFDPVDIVTEVINRAHGALEMAKLEGGNRAHLQPISVEAISASA